jgi:hypothetical protein
VNESGGDGMDNENDAEYDFESEFEDEDEEEIDENEDEKTWLERRKHRRRIIADWKASAKAIRDSANSSNINMLLRESRYVALSIIEDAARTEKDFNNVLAIWDEEEKIEGWRLDKHTEKYKTDLIDYELSDWGNIIPKPFDHVYWRQLLSGNFLDYIHDCPHEIHEMTSSRPVYDFTVSLDEDKKELLYYRAIRYWTPQRIAAMRDQTDRNIRKVYNNLIENIRQKMYIRLYPRYITKEPLTFEQREFVKHYFDRLDDVQKAKLTRIIEDEKRQTKKNKKYRDLKTRELMIILDA